MVVINDLTVIFVDFLFLINLTSAIQLTSSKMAIKGENFRMTCHTDMPSQAITITLNSQTISVIVGVNNDGSCKLEPGFINPFPFTCNPAATEYSLTIPGSFYNDSYHGSNWQCNPFFGGEGSNVITLFINGVKLQNIHIFPQPQAIGYIGENITITTTVSVTQWHAFHYKINSNSCFLTAGANLPCRPLSNCFYEYASYSCDNKNFYLHINNLFMNMSGTTIQGILSVDDHGNQLFTNSTKVIVYNALRHIDISPKGMAEVIVGQDVVITCSVTTNRWYSVAFSVDRRGVQQVCFVTFITADPCKAAWSSCENEFGYSCNKTHFYLLIAGAQETLEGTTFSCTLSIDGSNMYSSGYTTLTMTIPVSNATIRSDNLNNIVSVVSGDSTTLTCTTDASRPAAWIQWYIGGRNVTNDAVPQTPQPDGTMFISSSKLIYTGNENDHNTIIHCEALNIEGRQKVKSTEKVIYIQVPVTKLTFEPVGFNDVITVVSGRNDKFTCTTGPSRPAAMIQWYSGAQNVTNDAASHTPQLQGTMYVSTSTLLYTAKEADNGTTVYCEASNIESKQKVKSTDKTIHIGYLPDKVQEVTVICFDTALGVAWRSESTRGKQQIFQVVLQNLQTDKLLYSDNISDQGVGTIQQYTTQLSTATSYRIYIESTNIYGTVRSDAIRYCNTTGLTTTTCREEPLSFSAGFGSGAALIVCINIIAIIVVLVIKRRSRTSERSKVYEQTKQGASDNNVYNELDETRSGSGRSVQDYGNVAYEEITSTVDQTSSSVKPREK